jgi:hypothetical protein
LAGTTAYASVVSVRHAPGDNRLADLRALDQVKRDTAWAAVERTWARPTPGDSSRFADMRALDQVKRTVAWAAVERAWGG